MMTEDYSYAKDGFVGHLFCSSECNGKGVIVIMGGEQSILPGCLIAQRFADYGMMPNEEREKKIYRMLPIIDIFYKTLGKHRKECMAVFKQSEKEIITWILKS